MSASARLGRYRVGERIGEGGTGEVFRGEVDGAGGFSKPVAIKRIRPSLARDPQIHDAFLDEARLARRLEHGNIVQILDVGEDANGVPYLVAELVEGVTLAELCASGGSLAVADALYVVEHVAAALEYAHALTDRGGAPAAVVHRDVNPKNVLVSRDGVVKLADFGIAKALGRPSETLPGTVKGTLGYLSPEQAAGAEVGPASDQFSTGVVLYELLAGANPLASTGSLLEYVALLENGLPPLDARDPVDEELAAIVGRAVARDPDDRWPSVGELRHQLEAWRVARGIRTTPDALRRKVRHHLGEATTGRSLSLDDALPARRTETKTRATPAAPARSLTLPILAVLATLTAIILAVLYALPPRGEGQGGGTTTDAAPRVLAADPPHPDATPAPPLDAAPAPLATPTDDARAARKPDRPPPDRPRAAPGRLKVNVIPWARVTIDGEPAGRTPVDVELPAGDHELVLVNPDTGRRETRRLRVASDETVVITRWTESP